MIVVDHFFVNYYSKTIKNITLLLTLVNLHEEKSTLLRQNFVPWKFRGRVKKNREIKIPWERHMELNREIEMHKKMFFCKKLNWNDDFGL